MTKAASDALYVGDVVHKRLHPVRHALRYRVFSLLLDVDRLDETARRLKLFSHNRANLLSLHERDHGDGAALGPYLRKLAHEAGLADEISSFRMLCYPRVLGYVFNPLTVYFGLDDRGETRLVVYEVSNTFGERMSYVLRANADAAGTIRQRCLKRMYVSPFNDVSGAYRFQMTPLGEDLKLAIRLEQGERTVMTAYFDAKARELSDANLAAALVHTGWMTLKVIAGIHLEAAKLWLKGLEIAPRPAPPQPAYTIEDLPPAETNKA